MKFNFHWKTDKKTNEVDLISHPNNKELLLQLEKTLTTKETLIVTSPSNNRKQHINIIDIESISSLGHLSKITLGNQKEFFYSKRLKELTFLEVHDLLQINQSTIINLKKIDLFQTEKHARLELVTRSKQTYIVSRHFAKNIKERLLCSNN